MSTDRTPRELVLEQAAVDAARGWAAGFRLELEREGRAVDGGWPGTLSEARVRAGDEARRSLSKRALPALTHDELGRVQRRTYEEARRVWRAPAGSAR